VKSKRQDALRTIKKKNRLSISLIKMLSEKYLEMAKLDLREDEARKQQALQQFRDWLKKHPFIRSVRQGK